MTRKTNALLMIKTLILSLRSTGQFRLAIKLKNIWNKNV